jgi:predicted O-methyltransferase YrrM
MTQQLWTSVDDYITDLFVPFDPVLQETFATSEAAGLPSISVAPNEGKLLMLLARLCGARNILEIGTLGGYSTIWLARGMASGGSLITLEASAKHAEIARANIARAGLAGTVEVRVGSAGDTLPQLAAEGHGPFDLIFIDADKEGYPEYLAWALKLSRPGTIIADNVVREGKILGPADNDPRVQGARRFNQLLAEEPRVKATVIQTVGEKGHDGIAIAIVIGRMTSKDDAMSTLDRNQN